MCHFLSLCSCMLTCSGPQALQRTSRASPRHMGLLPPARLTKAEDTATPAGLQCDGAIQIPTPQSSAAGISTTGEGSARQQGALAAAAPSDLSAVPRTRLGAVSVSSDFTLHPTPHPTSLGVPVQHGSVVSAPPLFVGSASSACVQPAAAQRSVLAPSAEQGLVAGSAALGAQWEAGTAPHQWLAQQPWLESAEEDMRQAMHSAGGAQLPPATGTGTACVALPAPRALSRDDPAVEHQLRLLEQALNRGHLRPAPEARAPAAAQMGVLRGGLQASLLFAPHPPAASLQIASTAVPWGGRFAYSTQVCLRSRLG